MAKKALKTAKKALIWPKKALKTAISRLSAHFPQQSPRAWKPPAKRKNSALSGKKTEQSAIKSVRLKYQTE